MTEADFEILVHMMNGGKPPDFAVRLLEDICERTGLSWKARHVYLQKRRSRSGGDSWQAVLSIDGFRAVGSAHPDYAGQEGPFWVTSATGDWTDIPPDTKVYASKVGIRKKDGITTWGTAKYSEYAATGPGGMMWDKFPSTMIAKCAEMLAWRKTFPRVFGGLYGDAELAQQENEGKKMSAKELLKSTEVVAEVPVPPPGQGNKEGFTAYKERLLNASSGPNVKIIGGEIQKDKTLSVEEVLELHQIYTRMKKQYESETV
jgi:hypothetical protein